MNKIKIKKSTGSKPVFPAGAYSFVVGNGTSRHDKPLKPLMDYGVLIACNWFFKAEFKPHINVCSDREITVDAYNENKNYAMSNHFYTWFPKPGSGMKKIPTPEKMAAGISGIVIGAEVVKSRKIFMIGMDFFGHGSVSAQDNGILNNLYAGAKNYASPGQQAPTYRNWERRMQWILREYPWVDIYHVNPFGGKSPERLTGFVNFHQITWENMMDHLENDAELVDLIEERTKEMTELALGPNPYDARAIFERQLSGQPNVIFKDFIHPKDLASLRKAAKRAYAHGQPAVVHNFAGMLINIPPIGMIPPAKQGDAPTWLSDDELERFTYFETEKRFEEVKAWYATRPTSSIHVFDLEMIKNKGDLDEDGQPIGEHKAMLERRGIDVFGKPVVKSDSETPAL